jgi:hypothetical protein
MLTRFHELCWVFICRTIIRGQFRSNGSHMVGTAAPSVMAAHTLPHPYRLLPSQVPCTGVRMTQLDMIVWDQSNEPRKQCIRARRKGWSHHSGSVEPLGAAAPPRAGRTYQTWLDEPQGLGHPRKQYLKWLWSKEWSRFNRKDNISITWIQGPTNQWSTDFGQRPTLHLHKRTCSGVYDTRT